MNDIAEAPKVAQPAEPHPDLPESHGLAEYVEETERKPGEIVFCLLGTMIGVLGWYFALDMTSDSYSSPSVFPKITSSIIILCGIITLFKSVRRNPPAKDSPGALQYLLPRDVFVIIGMLLVYCLVLPILHFIPASYLFMVAGMVYLHRGKNIVRCLVYSAIALLVLVLVFRYLFLVILP